MSKLKKPRSKKEANRLLREEVRELDTTVLGVSHDSDLSGSHFLAQRNAFLQLLGRADHLLVEGNSYQQVNYRSPQGYEGLVLQRGAVKGTIHYLEENTDIVTISESYGISPEVNGVLHVILMFAQAVNLCGNNRQGIEAHLSADLQKARADPFLYRIDFSSAFKHFSQVVDRLGVDIVQLAPYVNAYSLYTGTLRDHEVFFPKCKGIVSFEQGKKVVMAGKNHFGPIVDVLRGKAYERPLQWQDHVSTLDDSCKRVVDLIEEVMD